MVKHTQTIRRLLQTNYLNVFDHSVGLALKGLNTPLRPRSQVFIINFEHDICYNVQYINHLLLFTTFNLTAGLIQERTR